MINEFWPNLITEGFVHRLITPVIMVSSENKMLEFFSIDEYQKWVNKGDSNVKNHKMKYYKGLGSFITHDFKRFLSDSKYIEQLTLNDISELGCIDLAFDKSRADERKDWLAK